VEGSLLGFGHAVPLSVAHGEEHIVAEAVSPMNAASPPVIEHFRRVRKPHIHVAIAEMHSAVFDGRVVRDQTNLRQRRDKISFEAHDLEPVRRDPGAPFKGDRVGWAGFLEPIDAIPNGLTAPLAEIHLPGQPAIPMSQPLARHVVIHGANVAKNRRVGRGQKSRMHSPTN
jgi:hypothetical protein